MSGAGPWRNLGVRRATAQVAIAEGLRLLDDVDAIPTSIWWELTEPALVLSRGSRVEADQTACAAAGVSVVRRGSGGGPVLWDANLLSLDVVIPKGHALWTPDVVASYRWLGELLARCCAPPQAGARAIPPADARRANDPGLAALACYAGVSPWEVMVGDRKLVGLSQVRRAAGVVLQAGIVVRATPDIAQLLAVDPPERALLGRSLPQRCVGLAELTDMSVTAIRAQVDAALADAA